MKKKTGLKSRGYVKVLVNIPVEHHALMKVKNDECGGRYSVNQQIRDAVRGSLCGLIYISLLKS
ncbi:MAG: hypothetical protein DYG86_01360 [Chloroflexi bacterium CFX2]|nr:hypothetical protein [Chloroflexi bacterium CFX2]